MQDAAKCRLILLHLDADAPAGAAFAAASRCRFALCAVWAALVAAQRAALVAAQPGRASLDGLPAPPWPWKASGRAAAGLPSRPRGWRCGAASRCARGAPAAALTRSGEGRAALEQPASACAALAAR